MQTLMQGRIIGHCVQHDALDSGNGDSGTGDSGTGDSGTGTVAY